MSMRALGAMLLVFPLALVAQDFELDRARLASHAQSFAEQLQNLICTETLKQRSISYSTRMQIRVGEAALRRIPPKVTTREIRSDLGYSLRGKDNPVWFELRKVIDVDGKVLTAPKKARERLRMGLQSDNERMRLKMMEEFSSYGLNGIATDYSLSLLLFRFGEIDKMKFEPRSEEYLGADRVSVFAFSRSDKDAAVTVFDGKQAARQPLIGLIWLRQNDMQPLRIQLTAITREDHAQLLDEGTIDYASSKFGSVLPTSVSYSRKVNGALIVETHYVYTDFLKFGADAELKFTP